ncbi:hypothetical protein HG702_12305 [Pectobacterium versatile]|nr:hypothetical protein HG702_12305 [Pectobacterium versatile]
MIKNIRNCCRRRWLLLRSVDAVYHWIGLSSLAILLFKVVVLNDIPAPVRFMSSVSPVVEGVLGSVIASYIFYLLCIHPPIFAAKKITADFEHSILLRIKLSFESHLRGISPTLNYDSTEQEIYAVFLALAPPAKRHHWGYRVIHLLSLTGSFIFRTATSIFTRMSCACWIPGWLWILKRSTPLIRFPAVLGSR